MFWNKYNKYNNKNNTTSNTNKSGKTFPPVKVGKTCLINSRVSLRSGFIGGRPVLRVSTSNEYGKPYGFGGGVKTAPKDNDTLYLTTNEYFGLRKQIFKMLQADDGESFTLDTTRNPRLIGRGDASVKVVKDVFIMKSVDGEVHISRDDFHAIDQNLNLFWFVFQRYNSKDSETVPLCKEIYRLVAKMMIRSVRKMYPTGALNTFQNEHFRSAFFKAYAELGNFAFSTEVLKRVELKFPDLLPKVDFFTLFHQCINQVDVLLKYMKADVRV